MLLIKSKYSYHYAPVNLFFVETITTEQETTPLFTPKFSGGVNRTPDDQIKTYFFITFHLQSGKKISWQFDNQEERSKELVIIEKYCAQ